MSFFILEKKSITVSAHNYRGIFIICLVLFMSSGSLAAAPYTFDSLFQKADVVLLGSISKISGGMIDDFGTEHFVVELSLDSVYKQNIVLSSHSVTLYWVVSNSQCRYHSLDSCIKQFANEKQIFFLKKTLFLSGDQLGHNNIFAATPERINELAQLEQRYKISINYFNTQKKCSKDCVLCANIKKENWSAVKKYIANHCNDRNDLGWMNHRQVLYTLSSRTILASLPSYSSTQFMLLTNTHQVEASAGFQVGYVKTFASWLPHITYNLWGAQWYKYFRIEKIDTLILKSFNVNSNNIAQTLHYEKLNYTRMITDTALQKVYGGNLALPDELVLLAAVHDGELRCYEDYKTMPNYFELVRQHIDELGREKKAFLLCMMAMHTAPKLATYSLQALQQVNDKRCLPFLIYIANTRNWIYQSTAESVNEQEEFLDQLRSTIDQLTTCYTHPQRLPYGASEQLADISQCIPVWLKKISINKYTGP